jgi:phosphoribosylformylglycinamidine synthase subunit PurS
MRAKVFVTLKPEVLDPQGDAVRRALGNLGFEGVKSVRVGKLVELDVDAKDRDEAAKTLKTMCEKLLVNPVIEDSRFEVE